MSQSPDYLRPGVVFKAGVFAGTPTIPKTRKAEGGAGEWRSGVGDAETDVGILGREKPSVATAAH